MVFKKVDTKNPEKVYWKFTKTGDSITGKYKDIEKDVGVNKSIVYVLDVNGQDVRIWDNTVLADRMNEVKIGDLIQIIYTGKKKNYFTFDVLVDDGQQEQVQQS
jgi:hypothetical protein